MSGERRRLPQPAVAAVQAALTAGVAFGLLDLQVAGSEWAVAGLAIANAILGMALGLFVSAFAQTEFQAVQFMPAIVIPQLLLCGLLVSRDDMAGFLQVVAAVLPLTYAYDGLARVTTTGFDSTALRDLIVVIGSTLLALALGATTLRRRTP